MGLLEIEFNRTDILLFSFSGILIIAILLSVASNSSHRISNVITESGIVLILSIFFGGMIKIVELVTGASKFEQSPDIFASVFYQAFLPFIIFNAGFTMKKKNFFKYMIQILTIAIISTVIAAIFYGVSFWGLANAGIVKGDNSVVTNLMFGSVVSATDTVAIITLFTELNVNTQLYSLVFGESVLNDAVAIVLFRTFHLYAGMRLEAGLIGKVIFSFLIIFFGSIAIGLAVGLLSAFILNKLRRFHISVTWELSLMLLFAYCSYTFAEMFELSGIFSVFVCSLLMAHYHWYSISPLARSSLFSTSGSIAYICETGCFIGLGITLFNRPSAFKDSMDFVYILISTILTLLCRGVGVVPVMFLLNIFCKEKVPLKHILMQWWAGLRGAVAIILALSTKTPVFVNAVYFIVLFTNLIMGSLTKPLIRKLEIETGGAGESLNMRKIEDTDEEAEVQQDLWHRIDNRYLKPIFGGKIIEHVEKTPEQELAPILDQEVYENADKNDIELEEHFKSDDDLPHSPIGGRRARRHKKLRTNYSEDEHDEEEEDEYYPKKLQQLRSSTRKTRNDKKRLRNGNVSRTVSTSRDVAFGMDEDDYLDGYEE